MAEGGGVEPPSRAFPGALVFGTRKRCRRFAPPSWNGSRDSNPVRAVLQTAASSTSASPTWHTREESNLESQFWRLLPSPSGRVHSWWACSDSNRERQPLLRRLAVPIYPCHRPETWSAGRDSNSQAPRSGRGDFTDLSTRGWYPGSDSNAQTQPSQGCDFTRFVHPDMVRAVGLEPTYPIKGNRVTAGQFCRSLTRALTRIVKEHGGKPGNRTPMCRGDGILAGFWATNCPCSPQR